MLGGWWSLQDSPFFLQHLGFLKLQRLLQKVVLEQCKHIQLCSLSGMRVWGCYRWLENGGHCCIAFVPVFFIFSNMMCLVNQMRTRKVMSRDKIQLIQALKCRLFSSAKALRMYYSSTWMQIAICPTRSLPSITTNRSFFCLTIWVSTFKDFHYLKVEKGEIYKYG